MCRRVIKLGTFVLVLLAIGTLTWHGHGADHRRRDLDSVQRDRVVSPSLSSGTSLSSNKLSTPLRESNSPAPSSHEPSQAPSNYNPSLATSSESNSSPTPSSQSNSSPTPSGQSNSSPTPSGHSNSSPTPSGQSNSSPTPSSESNSSPTPSSESNSPPTPSGQSNSSPTPSGQSSSSPAPSSESNSSPAPSGQSSSSPTPSSESSSSPAPSGQSSSSPTPSGKDSSSPTPSGESSSSPTPSSKDSLSSTTSSESTSSRSPHYLIFIIVLSTCSEGGRDARDTIRKTWAQDCHNKVPPVLVKFAIGTVGLSSSEIGNLTAEDKVHGDLLLLTNLHDTYSNLTRKVLYSFVWADQNVNFSYLLKVDDDTFIYVDDLHKEAHRYYQNGVNRLYWGRYSWKDHPITIPNHKWAEPHWFLCDQYLPYAFGSGYIISADLIHKIAITADYLQLYNNEDVSVGVWLSAYKIQRKDDWHFHHFQFPQSYEKCLEHSCWFITTTPQNMYKLHSQL